MTVVAIDAARYMRGALSDSRDTVMAAPTGADDLRMVYVKGRFKYGGVVTVFTNIAGLNVCRALADRSRAVVATCTVADYSNVIKHCWRPGSSAVAVIALIIG